MQKWVCIEKVANRFNAEVLKNTMDNENIPCVLVNKQDSSYLTFGYIELHVQESYVQQAKELLQQIKL